MANKKDPRTQVAGNQTGSSGFFSKRAHVLSKRLEFERHMSVFVFKLLLVAFFALVAVGVWIGDGSADISQEAEALLWVGVALAAVEILVKLGFWTGILSILVCVAGSVTVCVRGGCCRLNSVTISS